MLLLFLASSESLFPLLLLLLLLLFVLFLSPMVKGAALGRGGQSLGALCCLKEGVLLSCRFASVSGLEALCSAAEVEIELKYHVNNSGNF